MNYDSFTLSKYRASIFTILALPVFYVISRYNYSLFHSLADGVSIVIAACVFTIIWHERHLIDNDYFLYVGITFLFWAFLDFMHILGNKNMGVFPTYGNMGPAFYIATRYVLSISLMIAPLFINRKLNTTLMFAAYSLITLLILLSIFYWQIFPVCIIDGVGLTPFKIISDYIICLILLVSIGVMIIKRRSFDSRVLWLIVSSIILSIATGLSFTLYTDPFGIMNMVGHMFQIASFYLIYLALIETSLTKPQDILYRKLKQNEEALTKSIQQLDQAREVIEESEQAKSLLLVKLNEAQQIAQIGSWDWDMISNNVWWSDETYRIFEVSPGLYIPSVEQNATFTHPDDREAFNEKFNQAIQTGKPLNIDLRLVTKAGTVKYCNAQGKIIYDKSGKPVRYVGTVMDIADRKKTEEQIIATLESIQDGFFSVDGDWRFVYINAEGERILGINRAEVIGKSHWDVFPRTLGTRLESEYRKAASGETRDFENYYEPWQRWFHNKCYPRATGGMSVYFQDITKQKESENEIILSKQRLELALRSAGAGTWYWDMTSNRLSWSQELYILFGLDPDGAQATFDTWDKVIHPDDRENAYNRINHAVKEKIALYNEYRVIIPDGQVRWINALGDTTYDDSGKPASMTGICTDITDRKQAEAEMAALEAQNRQLQKSESLGRMAGAIAHHFNNQLGAVIGYLEMVIDEMPKGTAHINSLTRAIQSAWTAADMSGLMLTYLGQTHEKSEPLDLSYSCNKILPLIKATLPENVVMETDFQLPRPIIMANAGEMQQILTNLITNAWESIGNNKGTISLSVKTVSPAEIPTAHRHPINWQQQDKSYACMEVTDTGSGIEDKDIEKLFDPFYSTKFTGRGMGLAVVLGLTNSHKGVITVDSKPDRGSTLRIFFPVSEEALRQPQEAENDRDATTGKPPSRKMGETGTVLVVEDEEMLQDMAAAMLESFGFTVLKAKDGIEALEVFGKHQSEIKFVLTDLTMPRMNGWETLTALRKLQPGIPVILASGYDLAHVMEGVHPELPQAFLAKPYNLKALRNVVSQTLESRKK